MRQKTNAKNCMVAFIGALIFTFPTTLANAQHPAPVSLQEQLSAQYKVVKIGVATGEITIVEPGTVLDIQKAGIVGVIPRSLAICAAKYEDGSLKAPNSFCVGMLGKQNIRYLTVGEKVYPLKIDVNLAKEKVSFTVVECDSCNGVTEPSFYKGEVVFQFARGYLETASASQVEDTIGQIFAISSGDDSQQGQNDQGGQGQGQGQREDQGQADQQQQQPEPQTIQLGQTPDQVLAAMGKPEKIVNLGPKQIYLYKDLKVTFVNGKVSDVQ